MTTSSSPPLVWLLLLLASCCCCYWPTVCFAAMQGPGHCDLVTLPVLQAPDTSTACADFDTWQTAHPNQSWYENPWSSTSYRGAPGYVVGLTARNETACCQGKPPPSSPCVGACPCGPTNILHCGRYDSNDRCVAVEQCEVPGTLQMGGRGGVAHSHYDRSGECGGCRGGCGGHSHRVQVQATSHQPLDECVGDAACRDGTGQ